MTYPEKTLFCGPRKPRDVSAGRGRGLNFPIILSARLHGYVDLSTQSPQKRQSQSLLDCDSWHLHQPMLQETLEPVGRERQSRPQAGHRPCLCQSIPGCLLHQEREPASAIPHGIRHCGEVGPGDATVLHHVSVIMVNNAHNDPRQCLLRAFRAKSTPLKSHSQASAGDSCLLRPQSSSSRLLLLRLHLRGLPFPTHPPQRPCPSSAWPVFLPGDSARHPSRAGRMVLTLSPPSPGSTCTPVTDFQRCSHDYLPEGLTWAVGNSRVGLSPSPCFFFFALCTVPTTKQAIWRMAQTRAMPTALCPRVRPLGPGPSGLRAMRALFLQTNNMIPLPHPPRPPKKH